MPELKECKEEVGHGITCHYIPCDKFKSEYFSVHFILPLRKESAALYALLPAVLSRGCLSFPTKEALCRRTEELYAAGISSRVSKRGECQTITFSAEMLNNRFSYDGTEIRRGTFSLLYDTIFRPLTEDGIFVRSYVESEKKLLLDKIRAQINNKTKYALTRCVDFMCEGEPYGISECGREEDVAQITSAGLFDAYLALLREARVEIFYIGDAPYDTVKSLVAPFVSAMTERNPVTIPDCVHKTVDTSRTVEEQVSAVQGKLTLGFRIKEADKDAIRLFNAVYGASPVSKLFMNVREKMSLCYYCQSVCDTTKGIMLVYSGIENKNFAVAEQEILHQLEEIRKGHISEDEFFCAKQSLCDIYRSVSDSPTAIENWYLGAALSGDNRSVSEVAEHIRALEPADVAKVAAQIVLDTVYFMRGTGALPEGQEEEND